MVITLGNYPCGFYDNAILSFVTIHWLLSVLWNPRKFRCIKNICYLQHYTLILFMKCRKKDEVGCQSLTPFILALQFFSSNLSFFATWRKFFFECWVQVYLRVTWHLNVSSVTLAVTTILYIIRYVCDIHTPYIKYY